MSIRKLIRRGSVLFVLPGVSACCRAAVSCLLGLGFLAVTVSGATAQEPLALPDVPDLTFFLPDTATGSPYFLMPEATGGAGSYQYVIESDEEFQLQRFGLSFPAGGRELRTNSFPLPAKAGDSGTFTYKVTDGDGNEATKMFDISFVDTALSLPDHDDITLTLGRPIENVRLPEASGGTGTYTYYLSSALAGADVSVVLPGVKFNSTTRVLSGEPTAISPALTLIYHVQDTGTTGTKAGHGRRAYEISVISGLDFESSPQSRIFTRNVKFDDITLPKIAGVTPGTTTTYSLVGPNGTDLSEVPGLEFDPDPDTRVLSGRPTTLTDNAVVLTYTGVNNSPGNPTAVANISVFVYELGFQQTEDFGDRTFTVNREIAAITLPEAIGGEGPYTYDLFAPGPLIDDDNPGEAGRRKTPLSEVFPGLEFDRRTRVLSGEPTEVTPTGEDLRLIYEVMDANKLTARSSFIVTVITAAAAANDLNKVLLPEMARAMADSTTSAIARRLEGAGGGASASIGGQNSLTEALATHGKAMAEGELDAKTLLTGSDFVLPLAAAGNGATGGVLSSLALWGSGEYRSLDGRSGSVRWDGNLVGAHAGIDGRLSQNLLLGVAVSWHQSDLDYNDGADDRGKHELNMVSAHPYVGWNTSNLDLWATAGYGQGDLDITPVEGDKASSDVNLLTAGVGGNRLLLQDEVVNLLIKGEAVWSELEAEGSATVGKMKVDAWRARLTLEVNQLFPLAGGGHLEPSLEAGGRYDGGDGETGAAAEVGAGLNFHSAGSRVNLGGRVRALVRRGNNSKEWGVEGHVRVRPGAGGQGFSFSLVPGYGDSNSSVQQVWRQDLAGGNEGGADDYRMRLNTRLGYGFIMPGHNGVLTPYSEVTLSNAATYGLGVSWVLASGVDLTLHGERREGTNADAQHALLLKGAMEF